jgi:hypothetical protein
MPTRESEIAVAQVETLAIAPVEPAELRVEEILQNAYSTEIEANNCE